MTKIFFPYSTHPKQFSFHLLEPIKFPFYVNDFEYYWEFDAEGADGTKGIAMYILNDDAHVISNILLENADVSMQLVDSINNVSKHIYVEFTKGGLGIDKLGLLDPLTLDEIDSLTLGEIYTYFADRMGIKTSIAESVARTGSVVEVRASNSEMKICSDSVAVSSKNIQIEDLNNTVGITGLNDLHLFNLGELDQHILGDIDTMLSTFRVFGNIPATMVKEIKLTQKMGMNNQNASVDVKVDNVE